MKQGWDTALKAKLYNFQALWSWPNHSSILCFNSPVDGSNTTKWSTSDWALNTEQGIL